MKLLELKSNIKYLRQRRIRLGRKISNIFCGIFFILILLFPQNVKAAFSGGINIGDHFSEFDQAANLSGGTGWAYVMMQPEDWPKVGDWQRKYPNLKIIIRGHYPQVSLSLDYARRWGDALAQIPGQVYFIPVNEPNNPVENVSAAQTVEYVNALASILRDKQILGSKVLLISPTIDVFTVADKKVNVDYLRDLGGWSFFSQFYGIALNLYGQYNGSTLDTTAPAIKQGKDYDKFLVSELDASEEQAGKTRIFAVETGVIKLQDAKVKYQENATEIVTYLNSVKSLWGADPNFIMFAIFSYDPGVYPSSPWIYNQKAVLGAMELKTEAPVEPTLPPGSAQGLFKPEYEQLRSANRALKPNQLQTPEGPEDCIVKIFGLCLVPGKADDSDYRGGLAVESNQYQPGIVPKEKVVTMGKETTCDLICSIKNAFFGFVSPQTIGKETGALQAFLPREVALKSQSQRESEKELALNASDSSVLAGETSIEKEIKEKFANVNCLLLPRQFQDTCRDNLKTLSPSVASTPFPLPSVTPSGIPSMTPSPVTPTPGTSFPVCSGNSCSDCILNQRPDVLPYYQQNRWDTGCANQQNIVNNWCGISPIECDFLKNDMCLSECTNGGVEPTESPNDRPACPEGTGYCSVGNLRDYFVNLKAAQIASKICQRESGSDPEAANRGCLTGRSVDYSIGLFQINLLAHCAADAFWYQWDPPECSILDAEKVRMCEQLLLDPDRNILYAVELSQNGTNWGPWYTDSGCDPYK